jgi:hypothetical protein
VTRKVARLFAASILPIAASGPDLTPPAPAAAPPPMASAVLGPGQELVTYVSMGNELQAPLGVMHLSANYASFESHKGHMALEFAGVMPKYAGYRVASQFLSGASVYRVTNAEQYLFDNPMICGGKAPKFVVARFESLADVKDGTWAVNLWLVSLDDYMQFRPWTVDPCGGDTYRAVKD